MNTELGIIEGFYGEPWGSAARLRLIDFLKEHGFPFYIYAPKGDPYLRKKWREPMPAALERELAELAAACRRAGIKFGVGLSPYEMYLSPFDAANKELLQARIDYLTARASINSAC